MGGWAVVLTASSVGLPSGWALLAGLVPAVWAQSRTSGAWRRAAVVLGLPLSLALTFGLSAVPPWAWLGAAVALLVLYPLQAWRDAPIFPTPVRALQGLASVAPLPSGARILDVGSGLGHGMSALRMAYPDALVEGVERSAALVLISRLRPGLGRVRHADMWRLSWTGFSLVYCFQRPESMWRAWEKARYELAAGSWLVSLEFEVPGVQAHARLTCHDGRALWIYRMPDPTSSVSAPPGR
ncbi:MAG: class I SAM-dependent methyltransferase [Rubrivivax sp.]